MILVQLTNGGKLAPSAAASYERMSAHFGRPLPTNSTTRTRAEQSYLYNGWVKRLPGFNYALPPGRSVHEQGFAVDFDLDDPAVRLWLLLHALSYGWVLTNPDEPWHREYRAARDASLLAPITSHPLPSPPARKVKLMNQHIRDLYLAYLDRPASALEVLGWVRNAEAQGWSYAQTEDVFKTSRAEAGTVFAAFRHYLHREPSAADVAHMATMRIGQVFDTVRYSPENN